MKKITTATMNLAGLRVLFMLILWCLTIPGITQNVAINTTLNPANPSAGLDVDFPGQGFLVPRVALTGFTSVAPLAAHVAGMVLYNTSTAGGLSAGLYINDGSAWHQSSPGGSNAGDMTAWNGNSWAAVPGGIAGQYLTMGGGGTPVWSGNITGYATLSTIFPTAIGTTTATGGGTVTHTGGTTVTTRGVCWSTSSNPTVALPTKTTDGTGSGAFASAISGLTTGTLYYLRAYATNSLGTSYGNQVTFTTN